MNLVRKGFAWAWLVIAFLAFLPLVLLFFVFVAMLIATGWAFDVVTDGQITKSFPTEPPTEPITAKLIEGPDSPPPMKAEAVPEK